MSRKASGLKYQPSSLSYINPVKQLLSHYCISVCVRYFTSAIMYSALILNFFAFYFHHEHLFSKPCQAGLIGVVFANTPLLRTLALLRTLDITDKIQIPGESYRGLTGNDSRYYGLSLLRNHGHFLDTKITNLLNSTLLRKIAVC